MSARIASTPAKHISAADAAALVKPGMWLDFGLSDSQPIAFDQALAARVGELSNVKIRSGLSGGEKVVVDPPVDLADGRKIRDCAQSGSDR